MQDVTEPHDHEIWALSSWQGRCRWCGGWFVWCERCGAWFPQPEMDEPSTDQLICPTCELAAL